MAVKFLNMATMGSTPDMVTDLKQKGVVAWVDEQLAKPWNFEQESIVYNMMHDALKMRPYAYCKSRYNLPLPQSESDIDNLIQQFLANDDVVFNRGLIHGADEMDYHSSAIFKGNIEDDAQLRQRVAFALSQVIVASESTDFFFKNRGEALSYYYDILLKGAFGKYGDILYDVSLSPAMATYLSYANNRKAYINSDTNQTIYPDENYGREIMQLFSIGLFELNMDGTEKLSNGERIPTYSQEEVMAVSRVFTGLIHPHDVLRKDRKIDTSLWRSDTLHPMISLEEYHDKDEKLFLDGAVPAGQTVFEDIRDTVDILMAHPNTAPFIAKKMILRLAKSNPSPAYVKRVAEAFKNSGGDLGETVRAVLLDEEIWDDIKNDRATKVKEPYLAYIGMLKALDVQPWPTRTVTDDDGVQHSIQNSYFIRSKYGYLNQWPTYAPTVFNFYSDSYVPDSNEFKQNGWKAPESQLYTTKYMTGVENLTFTTLARQEKHTLSGRFFETYLQLDFSKYLELFKKPGKNFVDGPRDAAEREEAVRSIIEDVSTRLLGKQLDGSFVNQLVDSYKDEFTNRYAPSWNDDEIQNYLVFRVIAPLITEIVMSEDYMTH